MILLLLTKVESLTAVPTVLFFLFLLFNFPMFDRTVFFRLVGWVGTLGELRSKSPIVKPIHPLLERDRAKKDYGRLPARTEVRSASIRGKLSIL